MDNYQDTVQNQFYANAANSKITQSRTLDQLSSIAANIKGLNTRLRTLLYRFSQAAVEEPSGMLGTIRSDNYILTIEEIHRQISGLESNISELEGHA